MTCRHGGRAFEHHSDHAENDQHQQSDIERLAGGCVGFEDDLVQLCAKAAAIVRHRDHFSR